MPIHSSDRIYDVLIVFFFSHFFENFKLFEPYQWQFTKQSLL